MEDCTPYNLHEFAEKEGFTPTVCDQFVHNIVDTSALLAMEDRDNFDALQLPPIQGREFAKNVFVSLH